MTNVVTLPFKRGEENEILDKLIGMPSANVALLLFDAVDLLDEAQDVIKNLIIGRHEETIATAKALLEKMGEIALKI
jgi:hypothetical protein